MQSFSLLIKCILAYAISFYSLSAKKINGNNMPFAAFAGKKVLIVNTAINTADTVQYRKLEQLYQLYKDSLIIIAFPSNDFGNTPINNAAIKNFINTKYNVNYLLGEKISVKGPNKSDVYKWLINATKNGMMDSRVKKDFYKYLINKNGILVGSFDNTEDPMGANIRNAIEQP
jgi:glutathione peroxidase